MQVQTTHLGAKALRRRHEHAPLPACRPRQRAVIVMPSPCAVPCMQSTALGCKALACHSPLILPWPLQPEQYVVGSRLPAAMDSEQRTSFHGEQRLLCAGRQAARQRAAPRDDDERLASH